MSGNDGYPGISSLVIATDGSVYADVATECGAWLAARLDKHVTALYVIDARRLAGHFIRHVAEILETDPSQRLTDRVRNYYDRQGSAALRRAASICGRHGVKCETRLETGNVVKVLSEAAGAADLLVIGERGEDEELESGFLGSVTEKVLRRVKGPVLLTGLKVREFRRALVAYDGSDAARRAMMMLAYMAVALRMEVDAVQMVEEGKPTTSLKEVILYFEGLPVHVDTHYLQSDSHSVIIDHAKEKNCDLMAMGAYANRVADGLSLGTTTEYLIRSSPVPVLVHH